MYTDSGVSRAEKTSRTNGMRVCPCATSASNSSREITWGESRMARTVKTAIVGVGGLVGVGARWGLKPRARHAMQMQSERHAATVIQITRLGVATMTLGHQAYHIQPQPQMRRIARGGLVAQADQRVEQAPLHRGGQWRPLVGQLDLRAMDAAIVPRAQAQREPAVLGGERQGVVQQLVQGLRDQLRRT